MTGPGQRSEGAGRRRIGRADVEASFNNQVRNMAIVRHIGRPIGNALTPFFFNAGWTANQMTTLRLALSLAALVVLIAAPSALLWLAAALYYMAFVTDCIDGNLARLGGSVSYWGKFYDALADRFYYALAPLAAGIGLWRETDLAWPLIAGAVAAMLFTYNELIANRLQFFRLWMENQTGPSSYRSGKTLAGLETWNDRLMTNGFFVAPLLLLLPGLGLFCYFWLVLLLQGVLGGVGLLAMLYVAFRTLDRARQSKHAQGVDPAQARSPGLDE